MEKLPEGPFKEGYYAGLVNDARNPHSMFSFHHLPWLCGNAVGREVFRVTVETVYLNSPQD